MSRLTDLIGSTRDGDSSSSALTGKCEIVQISEFCPVGFALKSAFKCTYQQFRIVALPDHQSCAISRLSYGDQDHRLVLGLNRICLGCRHLHRAEVSALVRSTCTEDTLKNATGMPKHFLIFKARCAFYTGLMSAPAPLSSS